MSMHNGHIIVTNEAIEEAAEAIRANLKTASLYSLALIALEAGAPFLEYQEPSK